MLIENFSIVVLLLLGCANLALWGMLIMRKQKSMDQHHTAMFILGSGFLVLAYFFSILSDSTWMKIALLKFQYFSGLIAGTAWLGYIYQKTQFESAADRKRMFLPVFSYVGAVIFLLTNEWHGLVWKSITTVPLWSHSTLAFQFGLGFWAIVVGVAASLALGLYWVACPRKAISPQDLPWQRLLVVILLVPLGFGVVDLVWDASISLVPYAFGVCGVVLGSAALWRFSTNILPVAHETVIEGMEDGVIVLSMEGLVLELNKKAQLMLDVTLEEAYGKSLSELLQLPEGPEEVSPSWMARTSELTFIIDGEEHYFDLRSSLLQSGTSDVGRVLVMRDVTEWKRITNALKESEESYRNLFERVPVGLYRTSPDSNILDVNKALVDILGYPDRETLLRAESKTMYAEPRDYEAWKRRIEREGVLRDQELHLRRYDGSSIWLRENAIAIRNERNKIVYFEGSLEDITGTKLTMLALEQERNFIETVLDTVGALVLVLDRKGRIIRFNRACERLTGYVLDELDTLDLFSTLIPEAEEEEVRILFKKLFQGESVRHHENHWKTRTGEERLISWSNAVLHAEDGSPEYIISAGIDITDQRKAEKGLEIYAHELERSNSELENFAYIASHDLQEPLRMVASYLQLLHRRYGDQLNGDAEEFINFAIDGAKRMQGLIHGLLEYSRIGTRGGELVTIDMNAVVAESLHNLSILIEEVGGKVKVQELPELVGDHTQLVQLFQNLIGNALKFIGEETPEIHIAAEKQLEKWVFTVEDNGIGIDPKFQDRIFRIFQRLHTQQEYPGTGIGLAVCQRIVERHGGSIWVESIAGSGARFRFSIPERQIDPKLSRSESIQADAGR